MKVTVDESLCVGCGLCESNCSEVFKMDNGIAKVVKEDGTGCDVKSMAEQCPVTAIKVEE
ncbi:MAG: ferredoxin [Candidatus Gygaella obscura]|nr:ferredoxin [Candidatus Gygaella obscura]